MEQSEIVVELSALTQGGSCIGPITKGAPELINKKAFVPFTIPGESALAKIVNDKGSFCETELIEILSESDHRISAPCIYYGSCGGCQLQHITVGEQRRLKLDMVASALKVKGVKVPADISLIGEHLPDFNYRRRVSLHVDQQGSIGFYRSQSSVVVAINHCLVANQGVNAGIEYLQAIKGLLGGVVAGVTVEANLDKPWFIFKTQTKFIGERLIKLQEQLRENKITYAIESDKKLLFSNLPDYNLTNPQQELAGHFSQVNPAANALLVELVSKLISGTDVDDLYSGSGNLCLRLAEQGCNVRAVETDPALVEHGKRLAEQLNIAERIQFINSSAEKFIRKNAPARTVILDPPRGGAKQVCKQLQSNQTAQVVYVSCNLPSFVRDCQQLIQKGYALKQLFVLDMFPQTYHVETIAAFTAA